MNPTPPPMAPAPVTGAVQEPLPDKRRKRTLLFIRDTLQRAQSVGVVQVKEELLYGLTAFERLVVEYAAIGMAVADACAMLGVKEEKPVREIMKRCDHIVRSLTALIGPAQQNPIVEAARKSMTLEFVKNLPNLFLALGDENTNARLRAFTFLADRIGMPAVQSIDIKSQNLHEYTMSPGIRRLVELLDSGRIELEDAGPPIEEAEVVKENAHEQPSTGP